MSNHCPAHTKLTKEQEDWLRVRLDTQSVKHLLHEFNSTFGTSMAYVTICQHIKLSGLKSCKRNVDALPIGSTRQTRPSGAVEVKVNNVTGCGYDSVNWDTRANIVWREHFGEIPEGYMVVHLNGDATDDRIENLECITHRECIRTGRRKWFTSDETLTRTAIGVIRLEDAIKEAHK